MRQLISLFSQEIFVKLNTNINVLSWRKIDDYVQAKAKANSNNVETP